VWVKFGTFVPQWSDFILILALWFSGGINFNIGKKTQATHIWLHMYKSFNE